MSKPKVYVTGAIPEQGLDLLIDEYEADVWPSEVPPTKEELMDMIPGVEGLLCLLTNKIDSALMDAAGEQLKVISNFAVGYDNIDVTAATKRGIMVTNTPGVLTETTADLAFSLLMAAARRIVEASEYVQAGNWHTWGPKLFLGQDIHQKTLGIIGLGRIGKAVARRARGFNMKVLYYDDSGRNKKDEEVGALYCETVDELLKHSDFVSLHVPLTKETNHMIDAAALEMMKADAILINTSRGGVVDSEALYKALDKDVIAYAALDVTDPEPLPANHKLLTLSNCLVVPHIGSASVATRNLMSVMAAENLLAGLRGETPNYLVNREVLVERKD